MRVLLARHGQTDWNAAGKIQGVSDVPLNERGREQAAVLAGRVLDAGAISAVYTSPLKRARETAEIIGRRLGLEPVPVGALTELNFGDWEGCSWEEIGARWPEQLAAYEADRNNYAPPNGPFVDGLRRTAGGAALCVCHSAVMRGILAREEGLTVAESYRKIKLPNGSVFGLQSLV